MAASSSTKLDFRLDPNKHDDAECCTCSKWKAATSETLHSSNKSVGVFISAVACPLASTQLIKEKLSTSQHEGLEPPTKNYTLKLEESVATWKSNFNQKCLTEPWLNLWYTKFGIPWDMDCWNKSRFDGDVVLLWQNCITRRYNTMCYGVLEYWSTRVLSTPVSFSTFYYTVIGRQTCTLTPKRSQNICVRGHVWCKTQKGWWR